MAQWSKALVCGPHEVVIGSNPAGSNFWTFLFTFVTVWYGKIAWFSPKKESRILEKTKQNKNLLKFLFFGFSSSSLCRISFSDDQIVKCRTVLLRPSSDVVIVLLEIAASQLSLIDNNSHIIDSMLFVNICSYIACNWIISSSSHFLFHNFLASQSKLVRGWLRLRSVAHHNRWWRPSH